MLARQTAVLVLTATILIGLALAQDQGQIRACQKSAIGQVVYIQGLSGSGAAIVKNIVRDLLLAACSAASACSVPDSCRLLDSAFSDCILLDSTLIVPLQVFAHDWEAIAANKSEGSDQQPYGHKGLEQHPKATGIFEGLQSIAHSKFHVGGASQVDPDFFELVKSQKPRIIFVTRDMRDMLPIGVLAKRPKGFLEDFRLLVEETSWWYDYLLQHVPGEDLLMVDYADVHNSYEIVTQQLSLFLGLCLPENRLMKVVSAEVDWTDQVTNIPSMLFDEGSPGAYVTYLPTATIAGMNRTMHDFLNEELRSRYAPMVPAPRRHSASRANRTGLEVARFEPDPTFPVFAASLDQLVIVQSALHDPKEYVLRVFIDAHADAALDIGSCRAGRGHQAHSSPATLMFLNDGHYSWPMRGYIAQCRWHGYKPAWAALTFKSSREPPVPVLVHELATAANGTLAACVGVAYSHQDSHDWQLYHSQLGVDIFHQYYVVGNHMKDQEPVQPHNTRHLRSMSWQEIFPLGPELRYLFSQLTMYNECVYRFRYSFRYLMMIDTDEYIHLEMPQHQALQPNLLSMLEQDMPEHVAAMLLLIWAYPVQCQPSSPSESIVKKSILREATAQLPGLYDYISWINGRSKMIIRPQGVLEVCVHRICTVADGWDKQVLIRPDRAFVKHFRKWQWWDDKCEQLRREPV
ncbi:hypothetical protein WJX74_005099 [Apatococcus lobatus]|uniref:Sulfotransferase domain-containing protein n=1 Tax=Apatococcus lobatus TaxID=904363 RepID=A0AAW1R3B5_9CHLO